MPLLRKLLRDDPSIRSLVEVGAYYGYMLEILAREFPALDIHGIDLPDVMDRINAEFTAPNLRFSSGYARDLLVTGELQADVYLFVSTATRMKHGELRLCLEKMASTTKYVVFNELIAPLPGGLVPEPADVPAHNSLPVIYRGSDTVSPPVMVHNYKAIAESLGYKIIHYHSHLPAFTDIYRVFMIAKAPVA